MRTRYLFKNNLLRLLKEKKISKEELSKKIGVPYSCMRDWTNGNAFPRDNKIDLICDYFNIKVEELFKEL